MNEQPQDPLQQGYHSRKQRTKSPRSIKRAMMTRAQTLFRQQHQGFNLWNWSMGAGVFSLLIIFYQFIQYSMMSEQQVNLTARVIPIQIHQLQQEVLTLPVDEEQHRMAINYQQQYANYLNTHKMIASHHQLMAKVIRTHNEWILVTCKQDILRISPLLVEQLSQVATLPQALSVGEQVELIFDADGKIIGMNRPSAQGRC